MARSARNIQHEATAVIPKSSKKRRRPLKIKRKLIGWSVATILVMTAVGLIRRGLGTIKIPDWLKKLKK